MGAAAVPADPTAQRRSCKLRQHCPIRCAWCWPGCGLTLSRPLKFLTRSTTLGSRRTLCLARTTTQTGGLAGWLAGRLSCLKCHRGHWNAAWGNRSTASTVVVRMVRWDACQAQSWQAHAAIPSLYSAHRERAERRKLQRAIRQEERGAARELRRDAGAHSGHWSATLTLHKRAALCVVCILCEPPAPPCWLAPCCSPTHPASTPLPCSLHGGGTRPREGSQAGRAVCLRCVWAAARTAQFLPLPLCISNCD